MVSFASPTPPPFVLLQARGASVESVLRLLHRADPAGGSQRGGGRSGIRAGRRAFALAGQPFGNSSAASRTRHWPWVSPACGTFGGPAAAVAGCARGQRSRRPCSAKRLSYFQLVTPQALPLSRLVSRSFLPLQA